MGKLFRKTIIDASLKDCWEFFSDPQNLSKITPGSMGFNITNYDGKRMYEGQLISYTVRPLLGIPLKWTTEIRRVKENREFVDIQVKGPYRIWHHRHLFREKSGRVEMIDIVHYKLAFDLPGKPFERLIIRKKVEAIFDFRETVIRNLF